MSVRRSSICCLLLFLPFSCKRAPAERPWVPEVAPGLGPVVARVGEVPIFAAEVSGQAAHTGKSPRQALEDLIGLHLLAERLRQDWPRQDRDPQARLTAQEILVQRLLEREFEAKSRPEDMPDAAVRALYDAAIDKFVHGHLVEVAVLALTPGKKASAAVRAEARKTMTALKALVDARQGKTPGTPEDLQAAIAEGDWRAKRVQFFRFMQGTDKPYTARFGAEVRKMKTPGETSGLIEDEYGFYIARYVSERAPQNQTFEQVKKELRDGYYPRWRQARFLEFSQQLAAQHEVEIHTAALTATPGS